MSEDCKTLSEFFNSNNKIDKTSEKYNNFLKCKADKNNRELEDIDNLSLYPHLDDNKFNEKILIKKEFNDVKYEIKTRDDFENIIEVSNKICTSKEFEFEPHQMFVRNFLSFQTPYNSLLLFHGLGTGKTCSSISVCEEMRSYNKQLGITKKIIIVASPGVQENFKLQLFDERKLKEVNGYWNIKACTGNSFLKEINPMNMRGLSRKKVQDQIKKIIRLSYSFFGYVEFSNHLKRVMNDNVIETDDEEKIRIKQERSIKKEFSNRMIVIDEIHNLRVSSSSSGKTKIKPSSENIEKLVRYADNFKVMILSATPMFNSHTEIIWLLNILNINDNRFTIDANEVFNGRGDFLESDTPSMGKELLIQKARGYISYVRGENPFTFPNRIWPKYSRNENSLLIKKESGIWNYPENQLNGSVIMEPIEILDLVTVDIGEVQNDIYNKLIAYLKKENPSLNNAKKNIGFTKLEAPLQSLNMTYPNKRLKDDDNDITLCYGKKGLDRLMLYKPKSKSKFKYKDDTLTNYGRIFSPSEIGKYSGKIKSICDYIKKSKGLVFVFSQYIDSGAIPLALALEEMGFTRNSTDSLFLEKPTGSIDYLNMEPITSSSEIKISAKYAMITGDKKLTPNLKKELKLVTNAKNKDGRDIKVVIVTRAGSEGLDFSFIRQMHILDPWYNMNRIEQIIGRAVRNKSHCLLPYIERNVEIFLYATLLDSDIESADLYVYRLAEKKAKKIGVVTRVLKETAVDCLLNREGLDFSVDVMNKVVKQNLSSGVEITFPLGDKKDSAVCDYTSCSYKCSSDKIDSDLNEDTYNEGFIVMNIDKILQRIRYAFKEKYIYKKEELIRTINTLKSYPTDQIYSGLDYLINEKNEYIIDNLGRLGKLVNIGEYYMFQPMEIENKDLSYYERTHPVDYKRSKLKIQLPDSFDKIEYDSGSDDDDDYSEMSSKDITLTRKSKRTNKKKLRIYNEIIKHYKNLINPSKITTEEKEIWSKAAAWTIYNLKTFNDWDIDDLLQLSVNHLIDTLKYGDKVILLKYIYSKKDIMELDKKIKKYFESFIIHGKDITGIVLANYDKGLKYTMLILNEDGNWESSREKIMELGKKLYDKYQINNWELVNNFVGFITDYRGKDIVFKTKNLVQKSKRNSKGKRCDRGQDKKDLLKVINKLLDPTEKVKKYHIKGKKINSIRDSDNNMFESRDIWQIIDRDKKSAEEIKNMKANESVKINALQLCAEIELIIRYYDMKRWGENNDKSKDNKRWFFDSVDSSINDITNIRK